MEDEAKDSLRSLLGRGTFLALASSGCWECQCTLRESDEVDPLYGAEQSLHFRFPSGVRSNQMVLMGKLVSDIGEVEEDAEGTGNAAEQARTGRMRMVDGTLVAN